MISSGFVDRCNVFACPVEPVSNSDFEDSAAVFSSGFVDRCGVFEGSVEPSSLQPVHLSSQNLLIDIFRIGSALKP